MDDFVKLGFRPANAAAGSAKGKGGPDYRGKPYLVVNKVNRVLIGRDDF